MLRFSPSNYLWSLAEGKISGVIMVILSPAISHCLKSLTMSLVYHRCNLAIRLDLRDLFCFFLSGTKYPRP